MKLIAALLALTTFVTAAELPLKPGERITLNIGGIQEADISQIRGVYTISDAGTINLVHLRQVKAAGLKPSELQTAIEQAYVREEIFTKPVVTITTDVQGNERFIYVISGCRQNGPVAYTNGMKIMMAVSGARGFNEFAQPSRTKLIRNGKTIRLDLSKTGADSETELQPEDQIVIDD
ncbi:MAG: polysaccharide biosynthesis/export family protein [Verrucomicrobiaceae bacterium]|nr:polysaccharide biosynthesis/export family protein [Verrucomicrobiaceae bacterium]